jgi:hypothetical protein
MSQQVASVQEEILIHARCVVVTVMRHRYRLLITRISGLLLVVDVWDNPTALRRAWLVHFVLYARAR